MRGGKRAAAAGPAKAQPKKKPRQAQQPDREADAECPAKTGGRPRKTDENPYSVTSSNHSETPYEGVESFLKAQKEWACKTVPGKTLNVRH